MTIKLIKEGGIRGTKSHGLLESFGVRQSLL